MGNVRQLEEVLSKKRKQVTFNKKPATIEAQNTRPVGPLIRNRQPQPLVARRPPLFPYRLQKVKDNASYKEFLDILKQTVGLGEPRTTTLILQLADRPLAHHEGVIEDVLVQVGCFIVPADFIILDYEPNQEVPFILGCPFLATCRAIIDECDGKMTMRVGDRLEVFNVYKALRLPPHYEELSTISVVESDVTSLVPYMSCIDPLERVLMRDEEESEDEMME
ncbi:uncharacterized protein [Nicotiana tomentosiformis]|uniref:uncharacterized protein n=1 Tax=Nicotiana tomentosiformis TaxID=4098 RepID=UPI00051AC99A|nr:uncharacterized protein LOC104085524 [Nicotiana tomentosiformis]